MTVKWMRISALLLEVCLLAACGAKPQEPVSEPQRAMPETAETEEIEVLTAEAEQSDISEEEAAAYKPQFRCIAENRALWLGDDPALSYTIADLDSNGFLEVISARSEDGWQFELAQMFEVRPDCSGLDEVKLCLPVDAAPSVGMTLYYENSCYRSSGIYYFFSEDVRWEGEQRCMIDRHVMRKSGSEFAAERISTSDLIFNTAGDQTGEHFYDGTGKEITAEQLYETDEAVFGGAEYEFDLKHMEWRSLTEADDPEAFAMEAYNTFAYYDISEDYGFQVNIYPQPQSAVYRDLGEEAQKLSGTEFADTTVRFIGTDGAEVRLECGEWIDSLGWFHPVSEVFSVICESGEVYEFPAVLSGGAPEYRLTASAMGDSAVWYLTGSEAEIELTVQEPQSELPKADSPFMAVCRAYAAMVFHAGSEADVFDRYYWQTIGCAALNRNVLQLDPDPSGNYSVPDWLITGYAHAMFPYRSEYPLAVSDGAVMPNPSRSGEYLVQEWAAPYDTRVESVDYTPWGQMAVSVVIVTPTGEEGVLVYVDPAGSAETANPFGYVISGADIAMG